jgi:hypothetical protein
MVDGLYDLMGDSYVNGPVNELDKQMHVSFALEVRYFIVFSSCYFIIILKIIPDFFPAKIILYTY